MDSWNKSKLVDIAAKKRWALNGGPFGSKLTSKHYTESGVPVIRGTNLSGGSRFSFEGFVWVSDDKADELLPNNAHPGDLVFTQRGTIGQVGLIPLDAPFKRFVISQSQMKLTPDPAQADALFLYYFFSCPDTVKSIENLAFAAGVPHINLEILRSFEVPIPPLPVQRRIADILSAYDELIENSQRRIKILESMARALYREWFVNFRFPGHEKATFVDSPLGKIPKGWEVLEFRHLFDIRYGKILPKTEISASGRYPVYGAGDVIGFYNKMLCPDKCALVTSRGNGSGTVWRTREAAFVTNNSLIMQPRKDRSYWDFSFVELFLKHANVMEAKTGSAQPQVTIENLNYVKAIVSTKPLVVKFCAIVSPIYEQVDLFFQQIQNLRRTRDLLLPRLLSGQVTLLEN